MTYTEADPDGRALVWSGGHMMNGGGRSDLQVGLSPLYFQEFCPQLACLIFEI